MPITEPEPDGPRLAGRAASKPPAAALFRPEAVQAAAEPLHGRVTLVVPPRAHLVGVAALLSLAMLGVAAFIVEVPQRTRATGVLMPAQGFMKIVATDSGKVLAVNAREGERVTAGQALLSVSADRGVTASGALSAFQLESLEDERRLAEKAFRERERMQAERIRAADDHLANLEQRLSLIGTEIGAQLNRTAVLERRFRRLQKLAGDGNLPAVQLEEEALLLLQSEAATATLKRQAAQIAQERDEATRARASLEEETSLQQIEFAIAQERLQRQIGAAAVSVSRVLRSPENGSVGRVSVRPGQAVQAGQTLVTLWQADRPLQAWLYVPSAKAGLLQAGQGVLLRLDAYPHQVFGTLAATVTAISAIALVPSELDVPFALGGPVFEVRATLHDQHIVANGKEWPLAAGASFQADLVQRRYRLYEWLLRLRRDSASTGGA